LEGQRRHTDAKEPYVELHTAHYSSNLLDSKMTHLDDVLNEKLERAFHKQTSQVFFHDVAKIACEHDPIDLAYAVTRLPPQARIVVYDNLPDHQAKIIFMINTGSSTRSAIFREVSDEEIKNLTESMPPDEAVQMLDDLSDRRLKRVLELLDPRKAQRIRELQAHDRHSAGRLMTNEFFSFPLNTTIDEVATYIRRNPGIDLTRRIFVLNNENALIGYVPARNLIVNAPELPIRQVMRPVLHSVFPDASHDEVIDLVVRYKDPALPVVDPQTGVMLGVITSADVIEAIEDSVDDTIASFAGTAEDVSEWEPTYKRFLLRAPWLLVTLCAGLVSSTAMQGLSNRVWFAALPFFVPLITGMSGNVGIQCSSVLVRGISTGEFSSRSITEAIFKELGIGLMIATTFGIFCGTVVYVINSIGLPDAGVTAFGLGVTVAFGVFCASLTAASLGAYLPFFFVRCRIDPAVAAGPIVTAINDVLSTLIFFLVARIAYVFFS
jgi:magnesium transporter